MPLSNITYHYIIIVVLLLLACLPLHSQGKKRQVTLDEAINSLSLKSIPAKIESLNFHNEQLSFENYKKGLLPSLVFDINPINFNRSLRTLQQPTDGSYSYVKNYANNSTWGITMRQKVNITGGELNVGTRLNYLNEFSQKKSSFSTTPFIIGYSQQLWGGSKICRLEKNIEFAKNQISTKKYCSRLSEIQQETLGLFMSTLLSKLEHELEFQNKVINDTLLNIAQTKLSNGNITEFDYKQIELQSLNIQYASENAMKSYEEALRKLQTYLAVEENLQIVVPELNLPLTIDFNVVFSFVKKNNPFSIQQQIAKLEAEKTFYSVKLNNRFNGNLSLNYGINQYADNFAEVYRHGNVQQSVTLGLQIPVFQWGINKNKKRIAKNNYRVNLLNQEKSQREFNNQIKEKVNNYNRSVRLWIVSEKAYKVSQEQYQMLARKFALGKVSVYELTSSQHEQNIAMQQYYIAINDVYREYFSLRHIALYDFMSGKDLEDIFMNH